MSVTMGEVDDKLVHNCKNIHVMTGREYVYPNMHAGYMAPSESGYALNNDSSDYQYHFYW